MPGAESVEHANVSTALARPMSRRAWFYFLAVGIVWGLPYFFIRVAVRDLEPATLVFLRTALASLILVPVALHRRKWRQLRGHLVVLVIYTAVEMGIPWLLLTSAEQKVTSSFAGLMIAVVPLIGAAFVWLLGYGRPGRRQLLGLVIGLAGVVVLVGVDVSGTSAVSIVELFGCTIGYACGPIMISRYLADVPSFEVVTASVGLVALAYLPFGVTHLPSHLTAEAAWSVVALAVLCTVVTFMLFFALISEAGPTRAVVVTYLNPAVALLLGVVVLNEPFTKGIAIGFPVILAGSVLGTWTKRAAPVQASTADPGPAESLSEGAKAALAGGGLPDDVD